MARLPYPSRDTLPAELAELLGSMPRIGITEMLAHATSLVAPFLRLAQAQFTDLELSVRQRELLILAVAGLIDCEYEYAQHIPMSEAAGIDASVRERVRNGDFDAVDDPADLALLHFVAGVVEAPQVSEQVFESVRSHFTSRQIVEILQLVGFYWKLGRTCTVLDIEIDVAEGLDSIEAISSLKG